MNQDPTLISLVVPVFNEAAGLRDNLPWLLEQAATDGVEFELLAVDDGSTDQTAQILAQLAQADSRIRVLRFTRNFGKEAAIAAGLDHTRGAAAIVLDSDRQHPPQMIGPMIERWRQGFAVVEAIKRDRGEADLAGGLPARVFYRSFSSASGLDLASQTDFKLLDRSVINALAAMPELRRFFRGMVAWMGYPTARLPFDVPPRAGGASHWPVRNLVRYALDALIGFSDLPLKLIGAAGLLVFMVAGLAGIVALWQKLSGTALDGFTTVIILLALTGGAIMAGLGVVGLYVARIYEQVRARPMYLLRAELSQSELVATSRQGEPE
jgi:glycosyltransferase involved in cell wall biosynthesis